jgi:hypothetical protein
LLDRDRVGGAGDAKGHVCLLLCSAVIDVRTVGSIFAAILSGTPASIAMRIARSGAFSGAMRPRKKEIILRVLVERVFALRKAVRDRSDPVNVRDRRALIVADNDLEGIVAKHRESSYGADEPPQWTKIKNAEYSQSVDRRALRALTVGIVTVSRRTRS